MSLSELRDDPVREILILAWMLCVQCNTQLISTISVSSQLITLYPHMMPSNTSFMRSVPPLHEIADINQLSRGDPDKVWQYKEFLLAYLEEVRGSHTGVTHRKVALICTIASCKILQPGQ